MYPQKFPFSRPLFQSQLHLSATACLCGLCGREFFTQRPLKTAVTILSMQTLRWNLPRILVGEFGSILRKVKIGFSSSGHFPLKGCHHQYK